MQKTKISSYRIRELQESYIYTQILITGIELKVFDYLITGPKTAKKLSKEMNVNLRGIEVLCNNLVGMDLLRKNKETYKLAPNSKKYLVSTSDSYEGPAILWQKSCFTPLVN